MRAKSGEKNTKKVSSGRTDLSAMNAMYRRYKNIETDPIETSVMRTIANPTAMGMR